ncbi:MATE family efflux transporter [Pseudopedobacter beijingensis]|uniref:MATE family efflux transporter n=1 Tax=Pseudopedobacter beijingensis TaxID=1207056 RepID=A0ABW4IF50_9SPHI
MHQNKIGKLQNHKQIIKLAFPIILANAATPLLGLADTFAIGQTGIATHLGAIALGSLIFNFVYWGFGFLRMGTTGFVAQANGADNEYLVKLILTRSMFIGFVIGMVLVLLQSFISSFAMYVLDGSEELKILVKDFFGIRIWGAPATLITYSLLGALIGLGKTKKILWIQLFLNGVNISLNLFFVLQLQWGVKGVALGTLIAECATVLFAWFILQKELGFNVLSFFVAAKKEVLNRDSLWKMMSVNTDIMLRTLALLGGFAWFANQGAKFGDTTLAANHILLQFVSLSAFFLDGYAYVLEMFTGKAIGKKDPVYFERQFKDSNQIAAVTALLLALLIVICGHSGIYFLTKDEGVRQVANQYVYFSSVYVLCSFFAFQLDGVFIGATKSKEMRNASLISLFCFLISGYILVHFFGNTGLWLAFITYVLIRAVVLYVYLPAVKNSLKS